jgi:hypothetical protein
MGGGTGGLERGEEVEKGGWGNRCVGARGSRKSKKNTKRKNLLVSVFHKDSVFQHISAYFSVFQRISQRSIFQSILQRRKDLLVSGFRKAMLLSQT